MVCKEGAHRHRRQPSALLWEVTFVGVSVTVVELLEVDEIGLLSFQLSKLFLLSSNSGMGSIVAVFSGWWTLEFVTIIGGWVDDTDAWDRW